MKVQLTADAIAMGWATEGEEVTVKELREAVQDDILNALMESFRLAVSEGPLGKFQGSPEYEAELNNQINRIGKLFNYDHNVIS